MNATGELGELVLRRVPDQSGASARIGRAVPANTFSTPRKSAMYGDAGLAEHVGRVALLHDASAIEHDRDVAEQAGFGEVVRDLQHGESSLEVDRAQLAARDVARPRIERAERLVEQQHLGRRASARAIATSCRSPPLSDVDRRDRRARSTPNRSATSSASAALAAPYSTFSRTVRCGNRYAC